MRSAVVVGFALVLGFGCTGKPGADDGGGGTDSATEGVVSIGSTGPTGPGESSGAEGSAGSAGESTETGTSSDVSEDTGTGESTGEDPTGNGDGGPQACQITACQGKVYQCGDCIDNDGDGRMDDLNGDGRIDIEDGRIIAAAAERVERRHPELVGGIGVYRPTSAHSGFVHIDTRGFRARW